MVGKLPITQVKDKSYYIRKIAKSGNSRYLSVGTILPRDWEVVKVYLVEAKVGVCVLRLEVIK